MRPLSDVIAVTYLIPVLVARLEYVRPYCFAILVNLFANLGGRNYYLNY